MTNEVFEDDEGKKILEDLGITGEYEGIGNLIIGYPEVEPAPASPRKENRVYII